MSTPHILFDKNSSSDLKNMYRAAVRSTTTVNAAHRVLAALHALVEEAGYQQEMEAAVRHAAVSGSSVSDVLREREIAVLEQIQAAKAARNSYKEACESRKTEIQPLLNQSMDELFRLSDEIKVLQTKVEKFHADRLAATAKYKAAGLTDDDIEAIGGLKPSHGDLAEWKLQITEKKAREAQISLFLKSAPEFDLSILETDQTDHHSKR